MNTALLDPPAEAVKHGSSTDRPILSGASDCSGPLRVLVACEYSGAVRDSFIALGHDAMSCDLLPTDAPGPHHTGDVAELLSQQWDILIAFPPCTYLCSSGMHWTVRGLRDPKLTEDALEFVRSLMGANVPHIALENPVGAISTRIRKPDCVVHPWQYGHPESKTTCLWLKNLPALNPTNILQKPESGRWENQTPSGQNKLAPSKDRWKERSKTYKGIAQAMAEQWSAFVLSSRTNSPSVNAVISRGYCRTKRDAMTAAEYKATRERIGTQAEVARILGVNRVTIAKRESGAMKLTWEACLAMGAIAPLRRPKRARKSENDKLSHTAPPQ